MFKKVFTFFLIGIFAMCSLPQSEAKQSLFQVHTEQADKPTILKEATYPRYVLSFTDEWKAKEVATKEEITKLANTAYSLTFPNKKVLSFFGKTSNIDGDDRDLNLTFTVKGTTFSMELPGNFSSNVGFFGLEFIFTKKNDFYIVNTSGHESIPSYWYYNGKTTINLSKKLEDKLSTEFPPDWGFPPLMISVSKNHLRVEEVNYCCDQMYNVNDTERASYRKVFILNRKTLKIEKTLKVKR